MAAVAAARGELDGVLYCHATPTDNTPITTADTPDEAVAAKFGGHTGTVVIGHTHHQFDRSVGDLRVVNAGSVGMAYEGDVAAFWALVEDGEPTPHRTPFDVERAVAGRRASGWPQLRSSSRRTSSSRSSATRRSRSLESAPTEGAASGGSVVRTASTARSSSSSRAATIAGGRPARGFLPTGDEVEVVAHRRRRGGR